MSKGAWETNMLETETAAVRRDGKPLTRSGDRRRQLPKNIRWQQGSQLPHLGGRQPIQAYRIRCAQKLDQATK
jgi:hypothetical protein